MPAGLEALCSLSCLEQETLAAEPAKCFVVPPSPRETFPGQSLCPSSHWLGALRAQHRAKNQALLFPRASLANPALPTLLCSVEGRKGCQGFAIQAAFGFCCAGWKLMCVHLELEAIISLTKQWELILSPGVCPESPQPRAAQKWGRRRQSWGGMSARFAGRLSSEPEQ